MKLGQKVKIKGYYEKTGSGVVKYDSGEIEVYCNDKKCETETKTICLCDYNKCPICKVIQKDTLILETETRKIKECNLEGIIISKRRVGIKRRFSENGYLDSNGEMDFRIDIEAILQKVYFVATNLKQTIYVPENCLEVVQNL